MVAYKGPEDEEDSDLSSDTDSDASDKSCASDVMEVDDAPLAVEEVVPSIKEEDITSSNQIPAAWRKFKGWKCSYRSEQPEILNRQSMRAALIKKSLSQPRLKMLQPSQRIMKETPEHALLRQCAHEAQKERQRAYRLHFKKNP